MSSNLVNLPVCPPTPTHHSRKARAPDLRPPDLKAAEPPDFVPQDLREVLPAPDVKRADVRLLDTLDGWSGPSSQTSSTDRDNISRISLIAMSELRNLEQDLAR